jgi:hypothetical protein
MPSAFCLGLRPFSSPSRVSSGKTDVDPEIESAMLHVRLELDEVRRQLDQARLTRLQPLEGRRDRLQARVAAAEARLQVLIDEVAGLRVYAAQLKGT